MLRFSKILLAAAVVLGAFVLAAPANAANVALLTPCTLAEPVYTVQSPQVCQLTPDGDHTQVTADFTASAQSFGTNITRAGEVRLRCALDNAATACSFNCGVLSGGTFGLSAGNSNFIISAGQVEYVNVPPEQASVGWNCSVNTATH